MEVSTLIIIYRRRSRNRPWAPFPPIKLSVQIHTDSKKPETYGEYDITSQHLLIIFIRFQLTTVKSFYIGLELAA